MNLKEKQQKLKLSKKPEQEQNQRNGDQMEGYKWERGRMGERYRELEV